MPEWILILLVLFPPAATILLPVGLRKVPSSFRSWLPIGILSAEIILVLVSAIVLPSASLSSRWDLAAFSLSFRLDGLAALLAVLVLLPPVIIWLTNPSPAPSSFLGAIVTSAAILFVCADNVASLYLAWVVLDATLFLWRLWECREQDEAMRSLAFSQGAALMMFAGSILRATMPGAGNVLVALALWGRLGLFPFHFVQPEHRIESIGSWVMGGVSLVTGLSLWLRSPDLHIELPGPWILALASIALFASVLWAWRAGDGLGTARAGVLHASVFVPLAIVFGGAGGVALALWMALAVVAALALFSVALLWRSDNPTWASLLWLGGVLTLGNVPLTPAFVGRAGLYQYLWNNGGFGFLLFAGLTTTLVLVPLWTARLRSEQATGSQPHSRWDTSALILLAVLCAPFSFAPMPIAHAVTSGISTSADAALAEMTRANGSLGLVASLGLVIIPVVVSFLLRRPQVGYAPLKGNRVSFLARLVDLDWLVPAITSVGFEMGVVARNISTIAEENPILWIVLLGLWIAIFIVIPR